MKCSKTDCENEAVGLRKIEDVYFGMCKKHLEEYVNKRNKDAEKHLKGLEKVDFSSM